MLPLLPPGARILEIGAGAGWQARALAERGYAVEAIDTGGSGYEQARIWPVAVYDGHKIPFEDESFDVVFSSNVLEHIPHVGPFQEEIKRVLKAGGTAVHVLPSASWRVWTNVTHYAHLFRHVAGLRATPRAKFWYFRHGLVPPRHGERGNALTEIRNFSRGAWLKFFEATGWVLVKSYPNRLFYTGYSILDSRLPLRARRWMSYAMGSACNVICLRKPGG